MLVYTLTMETFFIVPNSERATELWPEPERSNLRAACQEMLTCCNPVIVRFKTVGRKRPRTFWTVIRPESQVCLP